MSFCTGVVGAWRVYAGVGGAEAEGVYVDIGWWSRQSMSGVELALWAIGGMIARP